MNKASKDKVGAAFHEVFNDKPRTVDTSKSAAGQKKQMVAIALSKARAAGANIPKMHDGGVVMANGPHELKKGEIVNPAVPAKANRGEDIPMVHGKTPSHPEPSNQLLPGKNWAVPDWGTTKPIHAPAPKPPKMAEKKFSDMESSAPKMHDGGVVPADGVYNLQKGETVVPVSGTESGRRPNPSGQQGLAGKCSTYSTYNDNVVPEGAANAGPIEHAEKQSHARNYPGIKTPAASKVEDAKETPGLGRKCAERQIKGDVRNEDTVSSFGGKTYKA